MENVRSYGLYSLDGGHVGDYASVEECHEVAKGYLEEGYTIESFLGLENVGTRSYTGQGLLFEIYKGYFITQYEGPSFTIQYEGGGMFFDNVETLEQCYYLIDNYYYSGIDGRLMKRDQAQEESGSLCPWND